MNPGDPLLHKKLAFRHSLNGFIAMTLVAILSACASKSDAPKPAELPAAPALIGVRQAWAQRLGPVQFALRTAVNGDQVVVADSQGQVLAFSARSGQALWRHALGTEIVAGVGSDGQTAAVVTRGNELVAMSAGAELWRQRLPAQTFTAPLVAGGRVFVATADRSVSAFDGKTGQRLWLQTRTGEPLVLRQDGLLMAVGDTLVVGQGGRMVGMNPGNGAVRWEAPIGAPRGTNDVERVADLSGHVSRVGDVVCARAFQASVGCVNAVRGSLLWSQTANGSEGVHGDDTRVIGVETSGRIQAWSRADGQKLWSSERFQYRNLSAPLVLGRSVVFGDSAGLLHFISKEDGAVLARLSTDGSALAAPPALSDGTLLIVTRAGLVAGYVPQ